MKRNCRKKYLQIQALTLLIAVVSILFFEVSADEQSDGTQLEYYAGGPKSILLSDSTFSDWDGCDLVEIDSTLHPENWYNPKNLDEIKYSYALAWDADKLYFYIEIDKPMAEFTTNISRLYYDLSPATMQNTGFIEFKYESAQDCIIINRATRLGEPNNDIELVGSIDIYSEEINGSTYIEASIPWSGLNEAVFIAEEGQYIKYNIYVSTSDNTSYLFAQDTSIWGLIPPWNISTHYPVMYFCEEDIEPPPEPENLRTVDILTSSYQEVNAALGMPYNGTVGTMEGWTDSNGALLTEGSFQSPNTISGGYMEGFKGRGTAGTQIPDLEEDGTIEKTIDLGRVVEGLYKFRVGCAQIIPENIVFPDKIQVFASEDGDYFQYLGELVAADYESAVIAGSLREMNKYTVSFPVGYCARYVRIKIIPPETNYNLIAVSEINAVYNEEAEETPSAIVSLGAKINKTCNGLRFGARYNKDEDKEVSQIGMLLYPTSKLGHNILDMDYYLENPFGEENPSGVALINAVGISQSDFVFGKAFDEYETFVFFTTITNIRADNLSTNITAVPFIEYTDGSILYGNPLVRNYNSVKDAVDAIDE